MQSLNPLLSSGWHDAAEQRVREHVIQMIASGRAKNMRVVVRRIEELSVEEQNRLDDLENGVYG